MPIAEDIQKVIDLINAFDDKCEAEEYTDTGEVWEVFEDIRSGLQKVIEKG